jgi:hypothetical protein
MLCFIDQAKDAETARDPVSPTSADDAEAKVSTTEGDDGCTAISVSGIVDSGQYLVGKSVFLSLCIFVSISEHL